MYVIYLNAPTKISSRVEFLYKRLSFSLLRGCRDHSLRSNDSKRCLHNSLQRKHYNSFGRLTRDYVYDEAGNLISVRRYHKDIFDNPNQGRGYQDVEVWNYFYDEAGTPLYHTYTDYVVCDDDGTPLKEDIITYTVDYTYGTYYIYTPVE